MPRLTPIPPAELSAEQRPLYDDMKGGIEKNFKGFTAIREDGALIGPWDGVACRAGIGKRKLGPRPRLG